MVAECSCRLTFLDFSACNVTDVSVLYVWRSFVFVGALLSMVVQGMRSIAVGHKSAFALLVAVAASGTVCSGCW